MKESKSRCIICNTSNVEIVYNPSKKHIKKPYSGAPNFNPTSSDFGIFYKLMRCKRCDVKFSVSSETVPEIIDIYSNSKDNLYLSQEKERGMTFRRVLKHLQAFAPASCRILDIGCAYGFFVKLAKEKGMDVMGVEISKDAYAHCRNRLGLNVLHTDVKNMALPECYFDIVTAMEIIEHIHDPNDFIFKIYKTLKRGGILYIVTPDTESLSARLLRYRWWSYRKMHLWYFSKNSLHTILRKNGFSVICSSPYKKTFTVNYMIQQFNRTGYRESLPNFLKRSINITVSERLKLTASFGDIALTARKI